MWGHVGYFAKFVHDAEYYAALIELSITSGLYAIVIISLVLKVCNKFFKCKYSFLFKIIFILSVSSELLMRLLAKMTLDGGQ